MLYRYSEHDVLACETMLLTMAKTIADEMALYDIVNSRTIKTASLRNLSRWAYNAIGFCLVDDSGKFWRWNFGDKLPPGLIFRLVDRAPRDRLRCLTTQDGAWNAIVATNKDRTQGDIHCYPSNNDESRIFSGVLAAFTQSNVGGQTVTHMAVVKIESEEEVRDICFIYLRLARHWGQGC